MTAWSDYWDEDDEDVEVAFPEDTDFNDVPYIVVSYDMDPLTDEPYNPEPVMLVTGANATARRLKRLSRENRGVLYTAFPVLSLSSFA